MRASVTAPAARHAAGSDAGAVPEDEGEESALLRLMSGGLRLTSIGDMLRRLLGMVPSPSGQPEDGDAGTELSEGEARQALSSRIARAEGERASGEGGARAMPSAMGFRYQEWDSFLGRYRPEWTCVTEVPASHDGEAAVVAFAVPAVAVQRQLASLRFGFTAHRFQRTGDDLVIDDVVRLVTDLRAGCAPDERVHRGLLRTRRDLGVLILVDASSSVRDVAADGRTVHAHQLALAWPIADGLHAAGDRVAIYGFASWGRERVLMTRLKGFDDRLGPPVAQRMARMVPAGFTRTGAALRHAGHLLESRSGVPHRLVVLLTDGLSYDSQYELGHAEADTRRAIDELRARHVHCLCLSVGGDAGADKLARVFGDSAFVAAERPEEILRRIGPLFRAVLSRRPPPPTRSSSTLR